MTANDPKLSDTEGLAQPVPGFVAGAPDVTGPESSLQRMVRPDCGVTQEQWNSIASVFPAVCPRCDTAEDWNTAQSIIRENEEAAANAMFVEMRQSNLESWPLSAPAGKDGWQSLAESLPRNGFGETCSSK